MDIFQLGISALVGGVCGAIGGLASKWFPKKFRVIIVGVFIAAGIAGFQFVKFETQSRARAEELDFQFRRQELYRLLAAEFPSEYNGLLRKVSRLRSTDRASEIGGAFTRNLRKSNANFIHSASQEVLVHYFEVQEQTFRKLLERHDAAVCYKFLMEGPSGLPDGGESDLDLMTKQAVALFEAIVDGKQHDTDSGDPLTEDWAAFGTYWQTQGATESMILLLESGEWNEADACDTYISMASALASWDADSAQAIRASMVYQMAIGD